jgi:hypothetical protein
LCACGAMVMADLGESIIRIWNTHVPQISLSPEWSPYLNVAAAIIPITITMALSVRRFRKVSSDLADATKLINDETKGRLNNVSKELSETAGRLELSLAGRLDAISTGLGLNRELEAVVAKGDVEVETPAEVAAERSPKGFRIQSASAVRNKVMEKWLDGRTFNRTVDPGNFAYMGRGETGDQFLVVLQTPYRNTIGTDGRLPFTLEVWVNNYKKLNFEWDSEGQYALRAFKKGDWVEDLAEWKTSKITLDAQAAA